MSPFGEEAANEWLFCCLRTNCRNIQEDLKPVDPTEKEEVSCWYKDG
jgi:hypothetical protein